MFKVPDVAKRLNCSISTIYGLLDSGKFACHRIGRGRGTVRVSEEDLQGFLANCHSGGERVEQLPPQPLVKLKHLRL